MVEKKIMRTLSYQVNSYKYFMAELVKSIYTPFLLSLQPGNLRYIAFDDLIDRDKNLRTEWQV